MQDHLEAGPMRRSTVTKIVHDAHQVFPVWRNQIREVVSGRSKERARSKTGEQATVNLEHVLRKENNNRNLLEHEVTL